MLQELANSQVGHESVSLNDRHVMIDSTY